MLRNLAFYKIFINLFFFSLSLFFLFFDLFYFLSTQKRAIMSETLKRYLIKSTPNSKPIIYQSKHDEGLIGILHNLCISHPDTWKMDVLHYFYVEMGSYFYPIDDGAFLRGF